MTECNAIIEANNEIDELKRENKKLNELCVKYGFEVGRLEEKNMLLKREIARLENKLAYKDQHNTDKFRGIEDWAGGGF